MTLKRVVGGAQNNLIIEGDMVLWNVPRFRRPYTLSGKHKKNNVLVAFTEQHSVIPKFRLKIQ